MTSRRKGSAKKGAAELASSAASPARLAAHTFALGKDEYVLFEFAFPTVVAPPELTPAEHAVACAVLEGRSNAEIGKLRGTSTHTIAAQLRATYEKLGVSGRSGLVRHCLERSCAVVDTRGTRHS
jgi:DNA-binding CsgD family transcriptional regulator